MPPTSCWLSDEGVLIRNFRLVAAGRPRWDALEEIMPRHDSSPDPREPGRPRPQVAANKVGADCCWNWCRGRPRKSCWPTWDTSAPRPKRPCARPSANCRPAATCFHRSSRHGAPIAVDAHGRGRRPARRLHRHGAGDRRQPERESLHRRAAVLYCFRSLIEEDIPVNDGVLAPLRIVLPECLLNPPAHEDPRRCPAMVGGNVETSQRVVGCDLRRWAPWLPARGP